MLPQSELIKTLLPVVAGSALTMAGTVVSLSFNSDYQQMAQLRAAYSTFLAAADEAGETTFSNYRDDYNIFSKYLSRRFRPHPLLAPDSVVREDDRRRAKEVVARLRKNAFELLLLEPAEDRRERVRKYVSQFLDSKRNLDREAALVQTFIETGTLARPPGDADDRATPAGDGDLLGMFYAKVNAAREAQNTQYNQLVNEVLDDDRWH